MKKSTYNSPFYNNPYLKDMQAFYAKESPIPPPDPITPPVILTPSPVLPTITTVMDPYFRGGLDEEYVSSEDEGVTRVMAFMAITEDEPSVGKASANREKLASKFNSLNQELSLCKSKLSNLRNTNALNCSLQNEITRLNFENESLKDDISDLKKVIKKWTSSKVTLDQLLIEQVPGNIVCALGGRGKRKDEISKKEVLFTKADESLSETDPEITSHSELECDNQDPLHPLPKTFRGNVVKKKTQIMSPSVPDTCPKKKAGSSTKQLLLTLMEDVKEQVVVKKTLAKLKAQSSYGFSSRKAPMIPKPYIDYKYYCFNDHHSNECEYYPGYDICSSIAHETTHCDYLKRSVWYLDSGCSRYMTGVKQYLHKYSKESGPKVVFGDNTLCDTEGYGSVNCN
ncbi:hypothetical protein Tco_0547707 [Tanacetum coccineum]